MPNSELEIIPCKCSSGIMRRDSNSVFHLLFPWRILYTERFCRIDQQSMHPSDAQQFMLPCDDPLIVCIHGSACLCAHDPNKHHFFWLPIIHSLTIAMMGKVELWCAGNRTCPIYGAVILGFLANYLLAGKIYRNWHLDAWHQT